MTTRRRIAARLAALILLPLAITGVPGPSATADSQPCTGSTGTSLRVFCERHGSTPGRRPPHPALMVITFAYPPAPGDAPVCPSDPTLFVTRLIVASTSQGVVVWTKNVCSGPGVPPPPATLTEQLEASTPFPAQTITVDPGARGLVGFPFTLGAAGTDRIAVGPITLSDGTVASGTAWIVADSWSVDGDLVTDSARVGFGGPVGLPQIGYVWSTAGTKRIELTSVWAATFTLTTPAGATTVVDLDPVERTATASFDVVGVQPVIDYRG